MPLQSNDVANMMAAQMGQFSQQAAYARQIGGILPRRGAPGMTGSSGSYANPWYGGQDLGLFGDTSAGGYGAAAIGGFGAAIPAAASGVSMAAGFGLMGHTLGALDPFTGLGRAFASGAGFGGQGILGTAGGIAGLGARGGLGAIGGGLAAAALPLAGYMAAGQALSFVGENVYQGAQNISQVGAMANNSFGTAYGVAGSRPGGQFSRDTVRQITSVLHEITSQESMATFTDLKKVMDQAGQMNLLFGISNASEFKTRFKSMVAQVSDLAKAIGGSLEEAMPLFSQMRSMGVWKPEDVMGTAAALRASGPGAGALLQTMGAGARNSFAFGGTLSAGASLGRTQFQTVQEAVRSGVLSDEAVLQLTGGTGGVEGQQMLAERLTGIIQSASQTPVGRLSMAGLGEVKNGKFTGRVDRSRLGKFLSGGMSIDDLQSAGMNAASTREGAASFTARQDVLGQNVMAEGGLELVGQMAQAGLDRAGLGDAGEEIQQLMIEKLFGIGSRDAQMIQKMLTDLPGILERRTERSKQALEDAFRSADEKQNRSIGGLRAALGKAFEDQLAAPIQELAETATTRANEAVDRLTDSLYGRGRRITATSSERLRLLTGQVTAPSLRDVGGSSGLAGRSLAEAMDTPLAESIRKGGFSGMFGMSGQRGDAFRWLGANLRYADQSPEGRMAGEGIRADEVQVGSMDFFGGTQAGRLPDLENALRLAQRRSRGDFSLSSAFSGGQAPGLIGSLTAEYNKLLTDPEAQRKILEFNKGNQDPNARAQFLVGMLNQGTVGQLHGMQTDKGANLRQSQLDIARLLGQGGTQSPIGVDLAGMDRTIGTFGGPLQGKARTDFINKAVDRAVNSLRGAGAAVDRAKQLGPGRAGNDFGGLRGGGIDQTGIFSDLFSEFSHEQIASVLTGDLGTDIAQFLSGGAKSGPLQQALAKEPEGIAARILQRSTTLGDSDKEGLKQAFLQLAALKGADVNEAARKGFRDMAGKETSVLRDITGLSSSTRSSLEAALGKLGGSDAMQDEGLASLRAIAGGLSEGDIDALRSGGGAFGGQVSALGALKRGVGQAGQNFDQFRTDVRKKLSNAVGYDVLGALQKTDADAYKNVMDAFSDTSAGGAKLTEAEKLMINQNLAKVLDPAAAGERRSEREDQSQKMAQQLTSYTEANTRFITAVDAAIGPALKTASAEDLFAQGRKLIEQANAAK